jgi:subtilase family serine protease
MRLSFARLYPASLAALSLLSACVSYDDQAPADLVVADAGFSRSGVRAVIENRGEGRSQAGTARLLIEDLGLYNIDVRTLAPGAATTVYFITPAIPADAKWRVIVDPNNRIDESREDNNEFVSR